MATPEELVQQAYASIGRTGFGEGLNQIDPGGYGVVVSRMIRQLSWVRLQNLT